MKLAELRKHYYIPTYKHENKYLVHDIKTGSGTRQVHKYLCTLTKKSDNWCVEGYQPTSDLDVLKANVDDYVSKLKYDSEYYLPTYNDDVFVNFIIHDYLNTLGFKIHDNCFGTIWYQLSCKNIYGKAGQIINLGFYGLESTYDTNELPKTVEISHSLGSWSFVSTTVNRDVEDIKKGIDSLLKPYLLGESVGSFEVADKMVNAGSVDILLQQITADFDIRSMDYRSELKNKLIELANKL